MTLPVTSKTLIFPCGVPAALAYYHAAQARGEAVLAASSLAYDPSARHFENWFYLPSVYADDFAEKLAEKLREHNIERIFCPVSAAHWGIDQLVADGRLSVTLLGDMPIMAHARQHAELMAQAANCLADVANISDNGSDLSVIEVAGLLNKVMSFFGETDEIKIAAMLAIFSNAPKGDIVEIGVLTGRSACVLEMLARRYQIGPVLAVDPWAYSESVQSESPERLQKMVDVWEAHVPFETFLIQLMPIAREGQFNYLPLTSREAYALWKDTADIRSPEFGVTRYSKSISILHIDGNHDYHAVQTDIELWLPHLCPGGWLILDDYYWLHGDGPRRAGDALIAEMPERFSRAFVCGRALFLQRGDK